MYTPQRNSPYNGGNPLRALGGKILGYASIALGAISIFIGLIPFINVFAIVAGIIGLIVGIIAFVQSSKARVSNKYALGGIALSILGIILSFMINSAVINEITDDNDDEEATETPADY